MNAEQAEILIGIVLLSILIIVGLISCSDKRRALDAPNDNSSLHLDELVSKNNLQTGGEYLVRIYRQSGNLQKDDRTFNSPEEAVKAAAGTFKRAKIEFAFVTTNTEVEFHFRRPYYHHGGAAEGKKVGSVEIYKVK